MKITYNFLMLVLVFTHFFTYAIEDEKIIYTKNKLLSLSIIDASYLIKNRVISSEQLVTAFIERAAKYSYLNAYITLDKAGALKQARAVDKAILEGNTQGKLLGVPLAIKDNIEVSGLPNTAGTPFLLNFIPQQNAPVIQALIDEGAIILGKSNMHELAFGTTSNNSHFGAVGNPYNSDYYPGGSSGGTATAISGYMAIAGIGTDTGGSVRIPASFTGITGFRPSIGKYSQQGITPISSTRDTPGPMARNVSDLILLNAAITKQEADYTPIPAASIRLGVPKKFFYDNLNPEVEKTIELALKNFASNGIKLVFVDLPHAYTYEELIDKPITLYETKVGLSQYLQERFSDSGTLHNLAKKIASPDVQSIFKYILQEKNHLSKVDYEKAKNIELPKLKKNYQQYFLVNNLDAMIFPTVPTTAQKIKGSDQSILVNGKQVPTFLTNIRNTTPASLSGVPAISIPAGFTESGLPIGLEIDGPFNSDERLLKIALTLESILATPHKLPDGSFTNI